MSRSTDTYKGEAVRQKYWRHKTKWKRDRKCFKLSAYGKGFGHRSGALPTVGYPKWLIQRKKERQYEEGVAG